MLHTTHSFTARCLAYSAFDVIDQQYFRPTPIDYKSIDLDYNNNKSEKFCAKSFPKCNEPKTQYSGHLFSLLWHVWTWPHLRVGILLYMGDGVKGLVKGGQLDVGWLECGLCPVRCVGDLLPTWVGPRFKYLVAAYYFDWWGWLYVQDAACNVLSIGGLHCGGFSLDSGVGWEGSLLLRTLSFDERVWGEVFAG